MQHLSLHCPVAVVSPARLVFMSFFASASEVTAHYTTSLPLTLLQVIWRNMENTICSYLFVTEILNTRRLPGTELENQGPESMRCDLPGACNVNSLLKEHQLHNLYLLKLLFSISGAYT